MSGHHEEIDQEHWDPFSGRVYRDPSVFGVSRYVCNADGVSNPHQLRDDT